MIMEAKTEIVVNYDCDILLPVESYLSATTASLIMSLAMLFIHMVMVSISIV